MPYQRVGVRFLQEAFGYRLAALGCTDATGRLVGVLPLVEKKSLLAGMHLSSLPNTPTTPTLAADRGSLGALLSAAAARVNMAPRRDLAPAEG